MTADRGPTQEVQDNADLLLVMTPAEHLTMAARVLATPVSQCYMTNHYLVALAHLGMAQVKQGLEGRS